MKTKLLILTLSALLLAGCGASSSALNSSGGSAPISSENSLISSQKSDESSKEATSEEQSQEATSEETSVISESSAVASEPTPVPGQGAWELTSAALPPNPKTGKLVDVDFSTTNGKGETISFHGSDLLTGGGTKGLEKISIDNTIQVSKETGYFYMTSGTASHIEFMIAHVTGKDDSGEFDTTGVPTIYSAADMTFDEGEVVELSRSETEDHHYYIYSCDLPYGRFMLANQSSYAIYIYYFRNLA